MQSNEDRENRFQEEIAQQWKDFSASRSEEEFYQYWLGLQSTLISGAIQSLLIVDDGRKQFTPVAGWPDGMADLSELGALVERVIDEGCGLLTEFEGKDRYGVAYPLLIDGRLNGVVAVEVHATTEIHLQKSMEALQWGAGWLELLIRRQEVESNKTILHRLKISVDLLALTLDKKNFSAAATAFTTELAMASECERVSLGMMHGTKIKLLSVSYSADVEQKMNLTKAIEEAMDEAIFQRHEVIFPLQEDEILISRSHEALSRQQSMASIATFPLFKEGSYYGCVTCERGGERPFSESDVEFFLAVTSLAGPALEAQYINDQPLTVKIKKYAEKHLKSFLGTGFYGRKMTVLLLVLVSLFLGFAKGDYRLSADISLEGQVRRAIVVPFDGFIDEAMVRAGDLVTTGEILCRLDDRDLRLLNLSKKSEHNQLLRQHQGATARHDRAQAKIIQAQLKQAQVEIDLVAEKISRTSLLAPFAGLVVNGDLSQRLGGSVQQGDVLFEIAPLDAYRVLLKVDERRINDVQVGQDGALILTAMPQKKIPFTITRITPIARAEEGRNYFRVEAELENTDQSLRPGMEGVGKVYVDKRRLIKIWTRDMVEWVRLFWWSWFA